MSRLTVDLDMRPFPEYEEYLRGMAEGVDAEVSALRRLLPRVERERGRTATYAVLVLLFETYARHGKREDAVKALAWMEQLVPANLFYCREIAEALLALGAHDLAQDYVRRGLELLGGREGRRRSAPAYRFALESLHLGLLAARRADGDEVDGVVRKLAGLARRHRFPVYDKSLLDGLDVLTASGYRSPMVRYLLELMWADEMREVRFHGRQDDLLPTFERLWEAAGERP